MPTFAHPMSRTQATAPHSASNVRLTSSVDFACKDTSWTPQLALPFVIERSRFPETFMTSEVDRYLGLPGQAISYKVGERVWLDARAAAQRKHGSSFDLKQWHAFGLELGPVGLETLTTEMARF